MDKHTPGPWIGKEDSGVVGANDVPVFETGCGCCTSRILSAADARLIAAAPDLLAALRDVANSAEIVAKLPTCGERAVLEGICSCARAAIAKATGEA